MRRLIHMAATRNKFMYSDFCVATYEMRKQKDWLMQTHPYVNDRPAYPIRCNVPRMPATLLANNAVDIESSLLGIGANNFIFPKDPVTPHTVALPPVKFYDEVPLYVPVLPIRPSNQRPEGF